MKPPERGRPGFRGTLRFRFALWTAGLLLMTMAAFGVFVYLSMAHGLLASIDDSLRLNASQAIAAAEVEDGTLDLPDGFVESQEYAELTAHGLTFRLLDRDGQTLRAFGSYRALPAAPDHLALDQQQGPTFTTFREPSTGDEIRIYTVPVVDNGEVVGIVQVAQTLTGVRDALGRLLAALLIAVPLLAITAGLGGYFLAARALAPIDRITRTAHRISAEGLSARLGLPPTDDEVGRLAATFDGMLARLDDAFQRERQFTADASHELRTPLAAMQVILNTVSEKRRPPDDYRQALADLAEEVERLRSLIEALLLLARQESSEHAPHEKTDLSTLLRDVTDSLRPLAEDKGLTLACIAPDGLALTGDSDGLIRLFANLLDNAIRYTERGSVTVRAAPGVEDALVVTVSDTGCGIPPEHLPRLFDRFYRVDQSRTTSGTGLGLAIALDIAQAHGGTIEVTSTVGEGTTFTVRLPASRNI